MFRCFSVTYCLSILQFSVKITFLTPDGYTLDIDVDRIYVAGPSLNASFGHFTVYTILICKKIT